MPTRRVVVKPWSDGYELYMGSKLGAARVHRWGEAEQAVRDLTGRSGKSITFRIAWDFDGCEDPREEAAAEREAGEAPRPRPSPAGGPSMFRTAVEAAVGMLPDAPAATVEQVALAVLRVALPLHETQHADAWKAAHERAVHFELESVKANERAQVVEKELERLRAVETKLREHLDSIGAAHQEGISARRTLDAMRETEIFELNAQLAEAATLLGHFVDHEDDPCSFDHHGACNQHGGSSLRRCDVAVGRELLARIRGGDNA